MRQSEALDWAAGVLTQAGLENARNEGWALMRLISAQHFPEPNAILNEADIAQFKHFVGRRAEREPFSHIAGYRDFWKHRFLVTKDVLDPRPETECLIDLALSEPFSKVLDLGTGSGCIVASLLVERPDARGVGTDLSEAAVLIAGQNAKALGVAERVIFPLSDWYDDIGGQFDLIVSNPPYIAVNEMSGLAPEVTRYEPRLALTDEGDGLGAYRKIAAGALAHLLPGGRILVEIGPTQAGSVAEIFFTAGLEDVSVHADLDGRDRVVLAYKAQE